ncbi:MAG: AAA family ATPase [Candidatus Methylomirabilia bacterium]
MNLQKVWAKAVLHQLEEAEIAGRASQLARVEESFQKFSEGENQFLIVQGTAGMGKSRFLERVRRNLARTERSIVKVNGVQEEGFRPYALMTHILVALLNQREDKGAGAFESLDREEISYLARILPQLREAGEADVGENERAERERLFTTLVHFIRKIVDSGPLIVLIDDLHLADEATLLLFRVLMMRSEIALFVCGTSADTTLAGVEEQPVPLEQFYSAERERLNIRKIDLTPLTAADIATYLREIFPRVRLPRDVAKDLAEISQGNPMFLGGILRKLVSDQKVALVGQQWVMEPLEEGYLPESLEEIVSEKIAALDEESRQLLAEASTLGEDVSLSFLTGSFERMEAKVLEFVDKAVAQGLLSSKFELNDETIRFLGRRIQEIAYGGIEHDRRRELHERIGKYQETLYEQRLLPSAATLAYHFKRSADQEKARKYAQVQAVYNQRVFNAREATSYSGEKPSEGASPDIPLDAASLADIPTVIRLLLAAVRSIRLYPAESKTVVSAMLQVKEGISQILARNDCLNLVQTKGGLVVNGQRVEVAEFRSIAEAFVDLLSRIELEGIAVHRGVSDRELGRVLETLGGVRRKEIDRRFWQRFCSEQGLLHIRLTQVRYTERAGPTGVSATLLSASEKLDQEDLPWIHEIIRWLLSAASNARLYPSTSKAVSRSIEEFVEAVHKGVTRRPMLTLARVGSSLLVNGETVDTSEFKALADSFVEFLQSIGLSSLTFLEHASARELQTFVEALKGLPAAGVGSEFWQRFSEDRELSGILFDHRLYEVRGRAAVKDSGKGQPVEEPREGTPGGEDIEPAAEESSRIPLEAIPGRVSDFLLGGRRQEIELLIRQLFERFQSCDSLTRKRIVDTCRTSLERLPQGFQDQFAGVVADPLLVALSEEPDPRILEAIAAMLHRMAATLILFGEYLLASRILLHLSGRDRQLQEAKDVRGETIARVLNEWLEPTIVKLLVEDLKSGEAGRQRGAAQLLGSCGRIAVPVLIDIIKQAGDLRVRELAAGLLAELGPEAAHVLKRELVLEVSAQERVRILEVIETVTHDIRMELAYALGDGNRQVREAAFGVAERVNDGQVLEVILEYAKSRETDLATHGIRCLGRLKPAGAVEVLVSILKSTRERERLVACCQALGQIADPATIGPLAKILAPRGVFSLRRRWSAQVRATAAFALGQISDPGAADALVLVVDDRDPRVRKVARARLKR